MLYDWQLVADCGRNLAISFVPAMSADVAWEQFGSLFEALAKPQWRAPHPRPFSAVFIARNTESTGAKGAMSEVDCVL